LGLFLWERCPIAGLVDGKSRQAGRECDMVLAGAPGVSQDWAGLGYDFVATAESFDVVASD